MREATGRLILFAAVLCFLALLPLYPVASTEFEGWFGPPGDNFRYTNGTAFRTTIEVLGGAFDWTTKSGSCVADAGGWVRSVANPLFLPAFLLVAAALWLLLLFGLSKSRSEGIRASFFTALGGVLIAWSVIWITWYGLHYAVCSTDFASAWGAAVALASLCLAVGVIMAVTRRSLARLAWRPPFRRGS